MRRRSQDQLNIRHTWRSSALNEGARVLRNIFSKLPVIYRGIQSWMKRLAPYTAFLSGVVILLVVSIDQSAYENLDYTKQSPLVYGVYLSLEDKAALEKLESFGGNQPGMIDWSVVESSFGDNTSMVNISYGQSAKVGSRPRIDYSPVEYNGALEKDIAIVLRLPVNSSLTPDNLNENDRLRWNLTIRSDELAEFENVCARYQDGPINRYLKPAVIEDRINGSLAFCVIPAGTYKSLQIAMSIWLSTNQMHVNGIFDKYSGEYIWNSPSFSLSSNQAIALQKAGLMINSDMEPSSLHVAISNKNVLWSNQSFLQRTLVDKEWDINPGSVLILHTKTSGKPLSSPMAKDFGLLFAGILFGSVPSLFKQRR